MRGQFSLTTSKREELIDITDRVEKIIEKSGIKNGICNVYTPHATGAIIINENYDPNICLDLVDLLKQIVPQGKWRHDRVDGNADSHIKSAILGPGETIPVEDGGLLLGQWQSLMFAELDGPRSGRDIIVTVMGDKD